MTMLDDGQLKRLLKAVADPKREVPAPPDARRLGKFLLLERLAPNTWKAQLGSQLGSPALPSRLHTGPLPMLVFGPATICAAASLAKEALATVTASTSQTRSLLPM